MFVLGEKNHLIPSKDFRYLSYFPNWFKIYCFHNSKFNYYYLPWYSFQWPHCFVLMILLFQRLVNLLCKDLIASDEGRRGGWNAWCGAPEKQSIYLYFCLLSCFKVNNWELLILKPLCIKKRHMLPADRIFRQPRIYYNFMREES